MDGTGLLATGQGSPVPRKRRRRRPPATLPSMRARRPRSSCRAGRLRARLDLRAVLAPSDGADLASVPDRPRSRAAVLPRPAPPDRQQGSAGPPAPGRRPRAVGLRRGRRRPLLVRRDGEELWVPFSGEAGEELEELIAREREQVEQRRLAPAPPTGRRPLGQLLAGVALVGVLAAVVWVVDSRSGWKGIDESASRGRRPVLRRGLPHRRARGGDPLRRIRDFVGAVQHADGVAEVGGRLAYLAPARCLDLYRLAFQGEVRSARRPARSPSSRTRRGTCVASATRGRPSATPCSRASSSAAGSGSPRARPAR